MIICQRDFFNPPPTISSMALKLLMISWWILHFSLDCFIFRLKNAPFLLLTFFLFLHYLSTFRLFVRSYGRIEYISHVNLPLVFRVDYCVGFINFILYNKQNIGKCSTAFASFKCLIKLPELEFSLIMYIFFFKISKELFLITHFRESICREYCG